MGETLVTMTKRGRPIGIYLLLTLGLIAPGSDRPASAQMPSPADFAMTPIPTRVPW
jgi:hypothetical protein